MSEQFSEAPLPQARRRRDSPCPAATVTLTMKKRPHMNMNISSALRSSGTAIGAVALSAAFAVSFAAPHASARTVIANGLPAGCGTPRETGSTSADHHLISVANGSCSNASANRTLDSAVYQDISGGPDRLVGPLAQDGGFKTTYSATASRCDNGMTNIYYGRANWHSDPTDNAQSAHTRQTSCSG